MPRSRLQPMRKPRGAALLLAMLILVLVATITAGMVWRQNTALTVEAAERARTQSAWILAGALDWARLILREDARTARSGGAVDSLDEPWATPLAEARLSTFLAADKDNTGDSDVEAFLSGSIVDAQSRWNLRRLIADDGTPVEAELKAFDQLCNQVGLPGGTAGHIAAALGPAWAPRVESAAAQTLPLPPTRLSELVWIGIEPALIERLAPWVELLPQRSPVNVNTAAREVLMAAVTGLDSGSAERLVQMRQREPFRSLDAVKKQLPESLTVEDARLSVGSSWFVVTGRLRLEDRVLEERSLLERQGNDVLVRRRERVSLLAPPVDAAAALRR
jgi:general secretion pathway protein K